MSNYDNLEVFKRAHALVLNIYKTTKSFPENEKYRLADQIIRAAYSVPSNIVEGNSKNTTRDYLKFLYISRGSIHELKYFLLLSKDLEYIDPKTHLQLSSECDTVAKMLNGLINSLKKKMEATNG